MMRQKVEHDVVSEGTEISQALIRLEKMFTNWGLGSNSWVVVDEMAYVLQGYDVVAEERVITKGFLILGACPEGTRGLKCPPFSQKE